MQYAATAMPQSEPPVLLLSEDTHTGLLDPVTLLAFRTHGRLTLSAFVAVLPKLQLLEREAAELLESMCRRDLIEELRVKNQPNEYGLRPLGAQRAAEIAEVSHRQLVMVLAVLSLIVAALSLAAHAITELSGRILLLAALVLYAGLWASVFIWHACRFRKRMQPLLQRIEERDLRHRRLAPPEWSAWADAHP